MDDDRIRTSDVPTGQIPSVKNLVCPLCKGEGFFETPLSNYAFAVCPLCPPVKAVAADTNEECETASQAHTGTKK